MPDLLPRRPALFHPEMRADPNVKEGGGVVSVLVMAGADHLVSGGQELQGGVEPALQLLFCSR